MKNDDMRNHSRARRSPPVLLGLAACLVLAALPVTAQEKAGERPSCDDGAGSLLISPKRVVFSPRDRSAEIQLMNNGCATTTYRVELIDMAMDDTGWLYEPQPAPVATLGRMVRFAPRQVRVAPGERQTVRMFLRRPADLEPGEYRSHLRLRAIPDAVSNLDADRTGGGDQGFSVRLIALPGIAIPIIVRHGQLTAEIDLGQLELTTGDGLPRAAMRLERTGRRSVYGDLSAELLPPAGPAIPVGGAKGVAVYAGLATRWVSFPLDLPAGTHLADARLRVTFRSRPDADGGGEPLTASSEITLP